MNQVLVSIVTPVYNAERFLKETIISIREQSYKNWELLLIDDCSNDNSSKIIKEFQKIVKISSNYKYGFHNGKYLFRRSR